MIKDIVNRGIVNLTNCEQEPIHIPGSIQPHGFLLGLAKQTLDIEFCSGNTFDFIGLEYNNLLSRSFSNLFGEDAKKELLEYISKKLMLSSTLLRIRLFDKEFLCTVHLSNETYILEAEPVNENEKNISQIYDQTSQFLTYMHDTHTLKELCDLVAKGTREITGYDRVMIYRFDKDYNGEVYAESKREDLEPFLGLHYPHTDIPKQARELYMQNLLRMIVDIEYTPVPIYTINNNADNQSLDLSLSILRSTSPIHVQYLSNMGVGATLTISLIYQKRLWGLIACHHYSPKNITPEIRLSAQLQGHFITSQIDLRQRNEEYDLSRKIAMSLEEANNFNLANSKGNFQALVQQPALLNLCNAAGVSILFNNAVYTNGITPGNDDIQFLANWLATYTHNSSLHTDKLAELLGDNSEFCSMSSGIVYHSLNSENNNCIIWYRPETKAEVHWGGDPNKAIEKDKNGLSPRKSFELWKEIVGCQSKPWLQPELDNALAYSYNLQRQINLYVVTREEEKYRKLSELLKETNSELENINWISTHDLQEPLRKIQLISSRILTKEGDQLSETVQDAIMRMNNSANRMQTLLIDILKYTRLKHHDDSFEDVNLEYIINEVKADLAESMGELSAVVKTADLPIIKGMPFLLKQLFSNLIANSIKYASPEHEPLVMVTAEPVLQMVGESDRKYQLIKVTDNGIGFDQEYAENIFGIFTRLHSASEFKGSGVGLALCKKIMQNHNGHITATSVEGIGTTMNLYFPVN